MSRSPNRWLALLAASGVALFRSTQAALIPSTDGATVYDTTLHVTWLANANLPATEQFGVSGINADGSMKFATALQWVTAMNAANYLGHSNWTLPSTPTIDATCRATGPSGNNFGFNCQNSAMGSLYYVSLGLNYPNTAVSIPDEVTGPFSNFRPYLYWSGTLNSDATKGYETFSFNTGWRGANVNNHYMYVLPLIPGKASATFGPTGIGALEVSADGTLVYDPDTSAESGTVGVTWLADANLASSQTFTAQCTNKDGTPCIDADGSMSNQTAQNWIAAMNAYNSGAGWLGHNNWQLPPDLQNDPACTNGGFHCTGSPMGELFYNELGLAAGVPVVATPDTAVGPFNNVQPYLYWSCSAPDTYPPCQSPPPAVNFEWSFSFDNGFQGTDLDVNELYVMVYWPDTIFSNGFEP